MNHFPKDFLWGTATSAFQIEGAADKDGKGPSIWDAFCQIPGKVDSNDNGNIACDHYHKMKEDVQLMKNMGLQAYRFSIAWPRILPNGRADMVNQKGIQFYSDLIDELLANGIEPWVTLYHWDMPLALEFENDGWLGDDIADLFADYARVCYRHFGDRVKNWITINEPWVITVLGYGMGLFAPGRTSNAEPYQAGHNVLLAHAKAVDVYRKEFQETQKGKIGITNNCDWREPATDSPKDVAAAQRAMEFFLAWFADPIYLGDYPQCMRDRVGDRLPVFTESEKALLKDSSDFFGLNHYSTMLVADGSDGLVETSVYDNSGMAEDQMINLSSDPNWKKTAMGWNVVPWGCRKLLQWINDRYDSPDIYITENGCAMDNEMVNGEVDDQNRLDYIKSYLEACNEAIQNGVQLKGYFVWSFMDNFEWASGYSKRFGIHHVDYETLVRTPKASALWYAELIELNTKV